MPKVESKLKYGRVPAKTPCPFSSVCHEKKAELIKPLQEGDI